ncbi:MAG: hypothetical protein K8S98_00475 [Planctomycetes bacterium]|nr:hypothetical protein [Planctomycetota bacterium]
MTPSRFASRVSKVHFGRQLVATAALLLGADVPLHAQKEPQADCIKGYWQLTSYDHIPGHDHTSAGTGIKYSAWADVLAEGEHLTVTGLAKGTWPWTQSAFAHATGAYAYRFEWKGSGGGAGGAAAKVTFVGQVTLQSPDASVDLDGSSRVQCSLFESIQTGGPFHLSTGHEDVEVSPYGVTLKVPLTADGALSKSLNCPARKNAGEACHDLIVVAEDVTGTLAVYAGGFAGHVQWVDVGGIAICNFNLQSCCDFPNGHGLAPAYPGE